MAHPELSTAYCEMLRSAGVVITWGRLFERLGIAAERLADGWRKTMLPAEWFHPNATPLDFDELISSLSAMRHPWVTNTRPLPRSVPVIGVYGKAGDVKGSFDLIRALSVLRRKGYEFSFLVMAGGRDREAFVRAVEDAGLIGSTWFVPFLPHWRVPGFIRLCTCVCFLERNFPVKVHAPSIPAEILACGGCAVLSKEVADKQRFAADLRDGENAFIVENPEDVDSLAATLACVVRDPKGAALAGQLGSTVVDLPTLGEYAGFYGEIFERALELGSPARREQRTQATTERFGEHVSEVTDFVARHMPATAHALGQHFGKRIHAEVEQIRGETGSVVELALKVMDGLADELARNANGPEDQFAAELARFESNTLWLGGYEPLGFSARGRPAACMLLDGRGNVPLEKRRPLKNPLLRMGEFRYNVESAAQAAFQGAEQIDRALLEEPAIFLWQRRGNLTGRRYRINARTKKLLDLCDGTRSIEQINHCFGSRAGASDAIQATLLQLSKALVIALI